MSDGNTDTNSSDPEEPGLPHEPTYSVEVGARALHKSRRWYETQLKLGRLPGHKAGCSWFLTASDIATAIELTRRPMPRPGTAGASSGPSGARTRKRPSPRRRPIPPQRDHKPRSVP